MTDREFLSWLVSRLVNHYGEDPYNDFVIRLRKMAESVTSSADEASNGEALGPDRVGTGSVVHGELGMIPSAVHVPDSSADSLYSVSEHAFEHSEHVMGRGNVNG